MKFFIITLATIFPIYLTVANIQSILCKFGIQSNRFKFTSYFKHSVMCVRLYLWDWKKLALRPNISYEKCFFMLWGELLFISYGKAAIQTVIFRSSASDIKDTFLFCLVVPLAWHIFGVHPFAHLIDLPIMFWSSAEASYTETRSHLLFTVNVALRKLLFTASYLYTAAHYKDPSCFSNPILH